MQEEEAGEEHARKPRCIRSGGDGRGGEGSDNNTSNDAVMYTQRQTDISTHCERGSG